MKAMIFAAGFGTRLRPLTDRMPKALVPVGGVPMLARVVEKLRAAGMSGVVVNAHHFADMIEDYVATHDFGLPVEVSREMQPSLETGGGIRHAAPLLEGGRFLVHNVDILSDIDLRAFIAADAAACQEDGTLPLASLCVREAEADRYLLFNDDGRLAGWTNVRTGEVRSPYADFNPSRCRRYSFCGIHVMSPLVLELMKDWPDAFSIIDFYLSMCRDYPIIAVPVSGRLIDIGSPAALAEAEENAYLG